MVVIKIPGINGLGKSNGCEKAPEEIVKILEDVHSKGDFLGFDSSLVDVEGLVIDNSDIEKSGRIIYDKGFEVFSSGKKGIFLGGDHSISYGLTRGFFDVCQNSGKEPCLIVFDAHPDLMEAMQEPTHEEWLRKLIDDGFPKENIMLVGIRNPWQTESQFIKKNKIKVISVDSVSDNLQEMSDVIMEFGNEKEVYVSIDIDVVDPGFAPGTGYLEPGGLSSREFLYIVKRLSKMKNLRGFDIVEINPEKDINKMTLKLGAEILSEFL